MPRTRKRRVDRHREAPYSFRPDKAQDEFLKALITETGLTRNALLKQAINFLEWGIRNGYASVEKPNQAEGSQGEIVSPESNRTEEQEASLSL